MGAGFRGGGGALGANRAGRSAPAPESRAVDVRPVRKMRLGSPVDWHGFPCDCEEHGDGVRRSHVPGRGGPGKGLPPGFPRSGSAPANGPAGAPVTPGGPGTGQPASPGPTQGAPKPVAPKLGPPKLGTPKPGTPVTPKPPPGCFRLVPCDCDGRKPKPQGGNGQKPTPTGGGGTQTGGTSPGQPGTTGAGDGGGAAATGSGAVFTGGLPLGYGPLAPPGKYEKEQLRLDRTHALQKLATEEGKIYVPPSNGDIPGTADYARLEARRHVLETIARSAGAKHFRVNSGWRLQDDAVFERQLKIVEDIAKQRAEMARRELLAEQFQQMGSMERLTKAFGEAIDSKNLGPELQNQLSGLFTKEAVAMLLASIPIFAFFSVVTGGSIIPTITAFLGPTVVPLYLGMFHVINADTEEEFEVGVAELTQALATAGVSVLTAVVMEVGGVGYRKLTGAPKTAPKPGTPKRVPTVAAPAEEPAPLGPGPGRSGAAPGEGGRVGPTNGVHPPVTIDEPAVGATGEPAASGNGVHPPATAGEPVVSGNGVHPPVTGEPVAKIDGAVRVNPRTSSLPAAFPAKCWSSARPPPLARAPRLRKRWARGIRGQHPLRSSQQQVKAGWRRS